MATVSRPLFELLCTEAEARGMRIGLRVSGKLTEIKEGIFRDKVIGVVVRKKKSKVILFTQDVHDEDIEDAAAKARDRIAAMT